MCACAPQLQWVQLYMCYGGGEHASPYMNATSNATTTTTITTINIFILFLFHIKNAMKWVAKRSTERWWDARKKKCKITISLEMWSEFVATKLCVFGSKSTSSTSADQRNKQGEECSEWENIEIGTGAEQKVCPTQPPNCHPKIAHEKSVTRAHWQTP